MWCNLYIMSRISKSKAILNCFQGLEKEGNVEWLLMGTGFPLGDENVLELYRLRRQWQPTPVLLSGISHGRRCLVGYSPWGLEESDVTEQLYFHFSLSWTGEGNGNPLQYSCLENPREGGAWRAAVYGITQSLTRLTRLSSNLAVADFSIAIHETRQQQSSMIKKRNSKPRILSTAKL